MAYHHVGRVEQLRHVNLISNCNVGNVYTDNQVYNKPSFWFNLNEMNNLFKFGNVVVLLHLC